MSSLNMKLRGIWRRTDTQTAKLYGSVPRSTAGTHIYGFMVSRLCGSAVDRGTVPFTALAVSLLTVRSAVEPQGSRLYD